VTALLGVVIGGAIGLIVPMFVEPQRARALARLQFRQAAFTVDERRRKIVDAYTAVGGRELGEHALQQHDDKNLNPDEKTVRNEVFLLGGDLDALLRAYVYVPKGPNHDDFERVMGPLRAALIRHDLKEIDSDPVTANLKRWSAKSKKQ
jgi:hypothetical protein